MIQRFDTPIAKPRLSSGRNVSIVIGVLVLVIPTLSHAQVVTAQPTGGGDVKRYCTSIAVAASDARFAYQTSKLAEVETRIKARVEELDAKAAEVRGWIERRDAIEKKAAEKLVGIYSKMRPETAATQIAMLDDDMAAAILSQLTPRQASAIFNEIVPERAGKLAGLIAATSPSADKKP